MDNRRRNTGNPPRRKRVPVKKKEPQIQYTPAKPFNRNRFLLRLATAAAVVLALFAGMSIFFKVDSTKILVAGAQKYTAWDVAEASGVRDGDGLLGLSKAKIGARICKKLPYVDSVRVGIKLPDTVHIEIKERSVAYAVSDTMSNWWLLNAEGRIIDKTESAAAKRYTQILGVKLQGAMVGEQAVASEAAPTTPTDEPALPVVSGKTQLENALQLVGALEKNGVMGNVDSIDVSDLSRLTLVYEDRFTINLGDTTKLDYKIASIKAVIKKLGDYDQGYLDASFTTHPAEVLFDNASDTKN